MLVRMAQSQQGPRSLPVQEMLCSQPFSGLLSVTVVRVFENGNMEVAGKRANAEQWK